MNQILSNPWVLVLLVVAAVATLSLVRLVRGDRPASPPGTAHDWRDEQLRWTRLRIG